MNPLFCDDVVDERLVDPVDALVPLREAVVCGLVHTILPVNVRPHILVLWLQRAVVNINTSKNNSVDPI
jgi:hypothetical protein